MKDFLRAKMSQIEGKKGKSLTFSHRFTDNFVEFCRDRRLCTFFESYIHVQNEGWGEGGVVKGRLNNVKKTALFTKGRPQ